MKRSIPLLSLLFGLLLSSYLNAAEQEDVRKRWTELLDGLESLQGNFIQHEYRSGLAPTRSLKGKFKMNKERKLSWRISDPYTQIITSNSSHLFVYEKELRQLIIRPLNEATIPPFFLLNDEGFKNMQIQLMGKDQFLLGTPDSALGMYYIAFEEELPVEMHWRDYSGQRIVLLFQDLTANKKIAARNFRYKPPPKTDIIYQE